MGWQKVPIIYCCLCSALCLTLFGLLIASSIIGDFYGSTILHRGECNKAGKFNKGIHAAATVTSFLVTLSSDAFLRLIVAPLPKDIERAHANAEWLEIGVNSWRNLKYIACWRRIIWALLILSSIPLQLLFQAAIFLTTTSTDYQQIVVSQGFLNGGPWAIPGVAPLYFGEAWVADNATDNAMVQQFQKYSANSNWTILDSISCRETYLASPNGIQNYRNLIIVIEAGPSPNAPGWTGAEIWNGTLPIFYDNITTDSYAPHALNTLWSLDPSCIAGTTCTTGFGYDAFYDIPSNFSNPWSFQWVSPYLYINDASVANFSREYNNVTGLYCLAEPFAAPCKIEVTNGFLLAGCICVLIKSVVAALTLTWLRDTSPVQCLGDMIQLGMQSKDSTTAELCTYDQDWFRKYKSRRSIAGTEDMEPRWIDEPRKWASTDKRWSTAVPKSVWWATFAFIFSVLLVSAVLLGIGLSYNSYLGNPFSEAGFGSNPNNSHLHLFGTRVSSAIVANLPQSILTACYFWFTGIYGRLFQARDWANFAEGSQRLKVSDPIKPNKIPLRLRGIRILWFKVSDPNKPNQKSSYLLGIPFFWGITFAICSACLHLIISESLYVVAKEVLPSSSLDILDMGLTFTLNFSTGALMVTLILAILTVLIPITLSFRRLPKYSIVVGTNSAAISTQCHPPRQNTSGAGDTGKNAEVDMMTEDAARNDETCNDVLEEGDARATSPLNDSVVDGEERSTENITSENNAAEDDARNLRPVEPLERDFSQGPLLESLEWGVILEGSNDNDRPGQLGLALEKSVVGKPVSRQYYM